MFGYGWQVVARAPGHSCPFPNHHSVVHTSQDLELSHGLQMEDVVCSLECHFAACRLSPFGKQPAVRLSPLDLVTARPWRKARSSADQRIKSEIPLKDIEIKPKSPRDHEPMTIYETIYETIYDHDRQWSSMDLILGSSQAISSRSGCTVLLRGT